MPLFKFFTLFKEQLDYGNYHVRLNNGKFYEENIRILRFAFGKVTAVSFLHEKLTAVVEN